MALSALDMFTVGIGPSSSHTVGPMRAAGLFAQGLRDAHLLGEVQRVQAELFGSLGATGHGHGSDKAVILGLQGNRPETVDTDTADQQVTEVATQGRLLLAGERGIDFSRADDVTLHRRRSLPAHPNGMIFRALGADGTVLTESTYYSVGGGFVVDEHAIGVDRIVEDDTPLRFPFTTGAQLLEICRREQLRVSDVMLANELSWRTEEQLRSELLHIWSVMKECVHNGCNRTEKLLPGALKVRRRAPKLLADLEATPDESDPIRAMDWVNLYALAVNEENASGGRIVTAPTNGAAGIVPAVLHFYDQFIPGADDDGVVRFLLTAAAVGILFKENASISGAEVGCQGEVGSACAMAAGGLCEVLGGSPAQVENAAEIGIEHNLGLTCDPVGGLVQIPCIERNAMASNKAINAARIALRGDGSHKVSLDKAIKTMRETGADMKVKYKETSRGGLAVNVIEC
ncbi:L-serine ammonia-lyase [Microlunatus lacustris]